MPGAMNPNAAPREQQAHSAGDTTVAEHDANARSAGALYDREITLVNETEPAPSRQSASYHLLAPPTASASYTFGRRQQLIERVANFILAAAGLLLSAPVMLLIALAVKLTSKGPVLYRQPRIGLNRRGTRLVSRGRLPGRSQLWARFLAAYDDQRASDLGGNVFMIYKFRTMCLDSECGAVWAVQNDPRSTTIGRFLRKYRLDELPQLFNVLMGDMNIVGPRPERPTIFARLCEQIEEYPLRQGAKPGITGWAQINLLYDTCVEDVRRKVRYDLEYLRRKSLGHDLRIIAKTLPSVLFRKRGW